MKTQRNLGFQSRLRLVCRQIGTHRIEILTPRNENVGLAMIEAHAATNGRGWEYRMELHGPGEYADPIRIWNI